MLRYDQFSKITHKRVNILLYSLLYFYLKDGIF